MCGTAGLGRSRGTATCIEDAAAGSGLETCREVERDEEHSANCAYDSYVCGSCGLPVSLLHWPDHGGHPDDDYRSGVYGGLRPAAVLFDGGGLFAASSSWAGLVARVGWF